MEGSPRALPAQRDSLVTGGTVLFAGGKGVEARGICANSAPQRPGRQNTFHPPPTLRRVPAAYPGTSPLGVYWRASYAFFEAVGNLMPLEWN